MVRLQEYTAGTRFDVIRRMNEECKPQAQIIKLYYVPQVWRYVLSDKKFDVMWEIKL